MTNADPSPLEIQRRFAALERRITKLEMSVGEIDRIVDPEGWIGEAFEAMETHMDQKLGDMKAQMDSMESKLDIIMRHITGMNDAQ